MVERIFRNSIVRTLTIAMIVLGVLGVVLEPDILLVKFGSRYAIQIMFGMLALGMFFFIFDLKRLMFTALVATGVLCVYLMETTNASLRFDSKNQEPELSIAHFAISDFGFDFGKAIRRIRWTDADVVSIQEVTPDWAGVLDTGLQKQYPYQAKVIRIDPYGQYIFSKLPLLHADTIFYEDIPHLRVDLELDHHELSLISTYTLPPLDRYSYERMNTQLGVLARRVNKIKHPVIILGELNVPPWAKELLDFKYQASLKDSRRGSLPTSLKGTFWVNSAPMDHILYTRDLECIGFDQLTDQDQSTDVGIKGTYQFIRKRINEQRGG